MPLSRSTAVYLALAALLIFTWWIRLPELLPSFAMTGFSPLHYTELVLNPGHFAGDFPNGVAQYSCSAVMQVYPLAQSLGLEAADLLPIFVVCEYLFLVLAAIVLVHSLKPGSGHVLPVLVAAMLVVGTAKGLNLGRWASMTEGLFYNFAEGLRLFAIAAAFRRRWLLAGLLLAGSFVNHPVMSLVGCMFLGGMLLAKPRDMKQGRVWLGLLLFLVLAGLWWFFAVRGAVSSSGVIPDDSFMFMTRLFSYHWLPWDMGLFTTRHEERFVQFMGFLVLLSHYLARPSRSPQLDRLAVGGMVAMAAITVLGVLLSLSEQPQLIKLALHRASMLLVIIGLVYVVDGLWRDIRTGPWWLAAVAGTVLISNFLSGSTAGFPVAFCLLLAWPSIKTFFRGKERPTGVILAVFLAAVLCLLMALYYSKGWLSSWQTPAYFGGKQNIVALFMLSMLMIVINFCKEKRESWKIVPGLAVLIIFFFTAVAWVQDSVPGAYSRTRKVEYMEAQLWAKDNTETDALFMVDPTISYGWRDFSSRSSFGVLREWLYTCYGYTNDYDAWVLGRERFGEYGIDLDQSVPEPSIIWGDIITEAVLKQFYTWDKERFAQLADKYGITHIVMQKMFVQADLGMDMVFENNFFIILAAP